MMNHKDRKIVGRLVGRPVCHNFLLKSREEGRTLRLGRLGGQEPRLDRQFLKISPNFDLFDFLGRRVVEQGEPRMFPNFSNNFPEFSFF